MPWVRATMGAMASPALQSPPVTTPRRMWALYVGGFMGPFGGAVTTPMLPELAVGLSVNLTTVTWAITSYMIPFALGMLVSGTLANRFGQARTVRAAFLLYAVASVACVLISNPVLFFFARGVQGLSNAFTSPVLIALITRTTAQDQLGRAFGRYTSMAAAGQAFAPIVGGLAAGWDYRGAFAATAVVGLALALLVPRVPDEPRGAGGQWRALANWQLVRASLVAFGFQSAVFGVVVLAAMIASDRFGLSPGWRGAVVAIFGITGFLSGPLIGSLGDRIGIVRTATVGIVVLALSVVALGWAPWLWVMVILVALAGAAGTSARIGSNTLAVESTPSNTGGATSIMMSAQFLGTAFAPALLLPLYVEAAWLSTLAAGGFALISVAAILVRPRRVPVPDELAKLAPKRGGRGTADGGSANLR